jgi:hypothetical protein
MTSKLIRNPINIIKYIIEVTIHLDEEDPFYFFVQLPDSYLTDFRLVVYMALKVKIQTNQQMRHQKRLPDCFISIFICKRSIIILVILFRIYIIIIGTI